MAEEFETHHHVKAELVKLSGGIFEVHRNGELIFSKRNLGRFPNPGEILKLVAELERGVPLEEARQTVSGSVGHTSWWKRLFGG